MRKLSISSLWCSAGRAREATWMHWDQFTWDEALQGLVYVLIQGKVHKTKLVLFLAGKDRHCCWFLDAFDHLTLRKKRIKDTFDLAKVAWLNPELQTMTEAGKKLGGWMKDCKPVARGGHKDYALFTQREAEEPQASHIPHGVCAGSARPGFVNFTMLKTPLEFCCHSGGWELTGRQPIACTFIRMHALPFSRMR